MRVGTGTQFVETRDEIAESIGILLDKNMLDGICGELNLRIESIDLENKLEIFERQHLLQKERTQKYMTTTLVDELKARSARKQTFNIKADDLACSWHIGAVELGEIWRQRSRSSNWHDH